MNEFKRIKKQKIALLYAFYMHLLYILHAF